MTKDTQPIEAILQDLIAELRERFDDESMPTFDDWTHMRRGVLADAKTAEVRLREVQGEYSPATIRLTVTLTPDQIQAAIDEARHTDTTH